MRLNPKLPILFLIAIVILSACGASPAEEQASADAAMTQVVGTMVAGFFATQTALFTPPPPSTNTPLPTNTFLPTPTPAPANTLPPPPTWTPGFVFFTNTPSLLLTPTVTGTLPTATANSGALAYGCNNLAFVRDVNYPSGTEVAPEESFVKTWKVENTGTCEWVFNYTLSIVVDEYFDSSWNTLGKIVQPGEWTELSVIVDAPKQAGTYTSYWRFTDGAHPFGATLGLTVVVKE
ncbi:MAG: hypothetical protein JNK32_08835 [Anaerolineales bacterium]|nr:hypothetical protein [Anaerolineales bacterium]